jgi:hypothetical protein
MISSEVQRTLVKSPPELWAEISDPESLARHLGEFGEIRITRVEPEQRVEWQSANTSGSVVIKPSGWGTKVMLTVTRELAEQPSGASEPRAESASQTEPRAEPEAELEVAAEAEPEPEAVLEVAAEADAALEDEPEPEAEAEPRPEQHKPVTEPEPVTEVAAEVEAEPAGDDEFEQGEAFGLEPTPELEPRRGFFARLFGRRRGTLTPQSAASEVRTEPDIRDDAGEAEAGASAAAAQPYNALAVWASQIDSDADAVEEIDDEAHEYAAEAFTQPQPAPGEASDGDDDCDGSSVDAWSGAEMEADADDAEAADDISAEIRAAEEVAAEQVTAVLTGVLDRLGAAHHRPFSRA